MSGMGRKKLRTQGEAGAAEKAMILAREKGEAGFVEHRLL
jgi:hypothetical protein